MVQVREESTNGGEEEEEEEGEKATENARKEAEKEIKPKSEPKEEIECKGQESAGKAEAEETFQEESREAEISGSKAGKELTRLKFKSSPVGCHVR